jgi:YkoY family integral membrane protein
MVRHLPKVEQKKALMYGLGAAFLFRLIAIMLAKWILGIWWLQGLGAVYLLYLPIKHFWMSRRPKEAKPLGVGFWQTVIAVELTDVAFALDSVLAGVSFIGSHHDKIWVVYAGAIIGIVLLRLAANAFIRLLERFSGFEHVAYALVAWIGVKLLVLSIHNLDKVYPDVIEGTVHEMSSWLFWSVLSVLAVGGTAIVMRMAHLSAKPEDPALS